MFLSIMRNYPDNYKDGILCDYCDNEASYNINDVTEDNGVFICHAHLCILSEMIDEILKE